MGLTHYGGNKSLIIRDGVNELRRQYQASQIYQDATRRYASSLFAIDMID